jgi:hypothetical protein
MQGHSLHLITFKSFGSIKTPYSHPTLSKSLLRGWLLRVSEEGLDAAAEEGLDTVDDILKSASADQHSTLFQECHSSHRGLDGGSKSIPREWRLGAVWRSIVAGRARAARLLVDVAACNGARVPGGADE